MIPIKIMTQPDDTTCGPTSLHAIYNYYLDNISLEQVIREVPALEEGGTLLVELADHAAKRGYKTTIYTYNLDVFDPIWFSGGSVDLIRKLREQAQFKADAKLRMATEVYIRYLSNGGRIEYQDMRPSLLRKFFNHGLPILTGLCATYLYNCAREISSEDRRAVYDDVRGLVQGHFVVLCGYDEMRKMVIVADPYRENSMSHNSYYAVQVNRLINSIMLGILTYDSNLLIVEKKG